MALHDASAGPLEIDVQSFFHAQSAHEWGDMPTQPGGHVRRLRALLVMALVRHVLWAHGQVPRPVAQLEKEVSELMASEGLQTYVGVTTAPDAPPLPRGRAPWLPTAHLVHALTRMTERLYALLCALPDSDAKLDVALVLGTSLQFPQWTAMLHVQGRWDACDNLIEDTNECWERRRKAAALLERKVTRALLETLPLSTTESAPTRLRMLVRVPAHLRVAGWQPRPHWTAPALMTPPEAARTATTRPMAASTARPSRMSTQVQGLLQQRHASRIAFSPRARSRAPVLRITVNGACHDAEAAAAPPGLCPPRDGWLECDTVVVGLGREGLR